MVRFFRKYQKFMLSVFVLVALAMVISSLGLEYLQGGTKTESAKAILVNDEVITAEQYQKQVRQVENQYRQMLGEQYAQVMKQFGTSIRQNVIDNLIESTLLNQTLSKAGFVASDDKIRDEILKQFPQGYDPNLLKASGLTSTIFLKEIQNQAVRDQFLTLISNISEPNQEEINNIVIKEKSTVSVDYVIFSPKDFIKDVANPSEEQLSSFYQQNQEDYRLPATIKFSIVEFNPDKFEGDIEVSEDEIEFYYTENQSQFKTPDSLNLQHVQLLYPKEDDPKKLLEVKEKAQEILGLAKANQDFNSLALKYSDDVITKTNGGNLGWVPKGRYPKEFDEKTYAVKDGGVADLIETDYGFHIVKVSGYKPSAIKPIFEVKDEIIKKLKKEQSPAIAYTKAQEFFAKFTEGDKSLADYKDDQTIINYNLEIISSQKHFSLKEPQKIIPSEVFAKLINLAPEEKHLLDYKNSSLVAQIEEFNESTIPQFDKVSAVIKDRFIQAQADNIAKDQANIFLTKAKEKNFLDVAKELNLKIDSLKQFNIDTSNSLLSNSDIKEEVFTEKKAPYLVDKVFNHANEYYLFYVSEKIFPDLNNIDKESYEKAYQSAKQKKEEKIRAEIIAELKRKSKIEVEPGILSDL